MNKKIEKRIYKGFIRDCIIAGTTLPIMYVIFIVACKHLG